MDSDDDDEFVEIVQRLLMDVFPGVRDAAGLAAAVTAARTAALHVWNTFPRPPPATAAAHVAASVHAAYTSAAAATAAADGLRCSELMRHEESRLSRGD